MRREIVVIKIKKVGDWMNEISIITEKEAISMINDTSRLVAEDKANVLQTATAAYSQSGKIVESVEFFNWMDRNYSGASGHMFSSNQAMKDYIASSQGKADWMYKQLQGKGYEYDWMKQQRGEIKNLFNRYSAGDVSNQPGFDVAETNLITGKETQYQMKAYISKANPDLHNTSTDIKVVTNAEKADVVSKNGYEVEVYKDRNQIIKDTNERMEQIKNGTASPTYTIKNVAGAMAKAGAIGCVVGMGIESVSSYKDWKRGNLTDEQYLVEIGKAGGNAGLTAAATTGIMIPIKATIVAAGASTVVTIPIAIAVSAAIDKIIAPCFGRGDYRKILGKAKYYQSMNDVYWDFVTTADMAADEYVSYIGQVNEQMDYHQKLREKSMQINYKLKDLYDSI